MSTKETAMTNTAAWDRIADTWAAHRGVATDTISYGRDLPTDRELRLVSNLSAKRVLDLGCGHGINAIAMAKSGAKVIAIDASAAMLDHAERQAIASKTKVELRNGDLSELAWLRAESIDFALSVGALSEVEDLDRALRQVHRVLKPGSNFVFSHAHPFGMCCHRDYDEPGALALGALEVRHSYFDESPITVHEFDEAFNVFPRSFSMLFGALGRAGFGVDALIEPEPVAQSFTGPAVPTTLIVKARKLGN